MILSEQGVVMPEKTSEWWLGEMPPTIAGPGPFEATIAATRNGPASCCAWEIREKFSTIVLFSNSKRSLSGASNEQRGYVAAALGAVASLQGPAELTIWSNSEYVTDGLTDRAQRWKDNGWLGANRKPVKNRELWELILSIKAARQLTVFGRHDAKDNHIPYDRVMALAKRTCEGT
jgi:ribonuclease HI